MKLTSEENQYSVESIFQHEIKIKKSVFIGSLFPAPSRGEAEKFIEEVRQKYADATHNCFAYRIDINNFRYYDDGEPSGTAGMPILNMIDKYHIVRSGIVVTRYFGGIKLGTGGLARAYSRCAEETIRGAPLVKSIPVHILRIIYPYQLTNQIQKIIHKYQIHVLTGRFEDVVHLSVEVPVKVLADFEEDIRQTGSGKVEIKSKK